VISKRIHRKKKTSNFERLGRYILEAKTDGDAILWTRTAEYIIDLKSTGNKVLRYRITNCEAEVPAMAMVEVLVTQAKNTRSRADKTYHLVISFPDGEHPTQKQLADIEDTMCQALGFGEHQRISAVHQDTDHLHLHLAINKVHPQSFKVLEPYRDYYIRNQVCRELEQRHGLSVDKGIGQGQGNGRAGDLEAHSGEQSLLSWIQENIKDQLLGVKAQNGTWEDLHVVLQGHGLLIQPRGAGLVIALLDGSLSVKASAVDRGLSFKALTNSLGEYTAPQAVQAPSQVAGYQKRPRQAYPEVDSLYHQYLKEKEAGYQARKEALDQLYTESALVYQEIKAYYAERRTSVKQNPKLTRCSKRSVYQDLFKAMKEAFRQQKQQDAAKRQRFQEQYPALTWNQWLAQKAEAGNIQALSILRSRKRQRAILAKALLTVESLEDAKTVIHVHLKPKALKNGDLLYRLKDGGVVLDDAREIRVLEVTEASTLLALSLVDERFSGQRIIVEGTDEFKRILVKQAALDGLSIQFADPILEKDRLMFARARELNREQPKSSRHAYEPVRTAENAQDQKDKGQSKGRDL
jgi:hypothetical protein